ncbi:MAG TPA: hypothetical protein VF586_19870 [Pyrinomonadaceae bacterium]|jgi:hypothetical protein
MSKRLIPVVLFLALVACSGGAVAPEPCDAGEAADEYAVYSAAVEEFSAGRDGTSVVILDHTQDVSDPGSAAGVWARRCEALVPEAEKSMADSYRERNRSPLVLSRYFTLKPEDYALTSEAELRTIPADAMRSEGFGAAYRDAFGVVGLSRPGFNAGTDKAVLYVSQGFCGLGCGEGVCMLLVREGCDWKVKAQRRVWMS